MNCSSVLLLKENANMHSDQIQILDCTLRDAGYPIKFQFTKSDIQKICMNLEKSGLDKIEVGHGLGVSADRNMKFQITLVSNLVTFREESISVKNA